MTAFRTGLSSRNLIGVQRPPSIIDPEPWTPIRSRPNRSVSNRPNPQGVKNFMAWLQVSFPHVHRRVQISAREGGTVAGLGSWFDILDRALDTADKVVTSQNDRKLIQKQVDAVKAGVNIKPQDFWGFGRDRPINVQTAGRNPAWIFPVIGAGVLALLLMK